MWLKNQNLFFGRVKNIVGKGENTGNISPFPTMFSKGVLYRVVKSRHFVVKVMLYIFIEDKRIILSLKWLRTLWEQGKYTYVDYQYFLFLPDDKTLALTFFLYAHVLKDQGILFYHCPSVRPSVRLHKINMKT